MNYLSLRKYHLEIWLQWLVSGKIYSTLCRNLKKDKSHYRWLWFCSFWVVCILYFLFCTLWSKVQLNIVDFTWLKMARRDKKYTDAVYKIVWHTHGNYRGTCFSLSECDTILWNFPKSPVHLISGFLQHTFFNAHFFPPKNKWWNS